MIALGVRVEGKPKEALQISVNSDHQTTQKNPPRSPTQHTGEQIKAMVLVRLPVVLKYSMILFLLRD